MIDLSKFKKLFIAGIELKELYAGKKYTNQVPISTDADGVTIYNGGKGYKDGYRIRSGGAEGATTAGSCTGFIPVKGGDAVYFSGWDFSAKYNENAVNVADSSFTNIGQFAGQGEYGIFAPGAAYAAYSRGSVIEESSGVWKWVVPPAASGVSYIRVSGFTRPTGYGNYSNMIVTINEEIGTQQVLLWKGVSYTNQIPISTDANGNIYNGKGWKDATYDNNGNVGGNITTDLTGFIPCKAGDVIRLKNMPFNSTVAQCRLTLYTSDKSFIAQYIVGSSWYMDTELKGVKDSSGNYIQWTMQNLSGTVGFIRITAISITADSVVTINEEID